LVLVASVQWSNWRLERPSEEGGANNYNCHLEKAKAD
jgi:hypothetical protein